MRIILSRTSGRQLSDDWQNAVDEVKGVVLVDEVERSSLDDDLVLPDRALLGHGRGQDRSSFEGLLGKLAEGEAPDKFVVSGSKRSSHPRC